MRGHPLGLSTLLSFCLLLISVSVDAAEKAGADKAEPVRLTAKQIEAQKQKQRDEIQALFTEFKKPYESGKRHGIADRLIEYGPETAGKLVRQIAADFQGKYQGYASGLQNAAPARKLSKADTEEIKSLRHTVLILSKDRKPTKSEILRKADPAMARLKELLIVSSLSIRSSALKLRLKSRREELLELVTIWAKAFEVWAIPQDVAALLAKLKDTDAAVRQTTALALGAMGFAARGAIPALTKVKEKDPIAGVRQAARLALLQINSAKAPLPPKTTEAKKKPANASAASGTKTSSSKLSKSMASKAPPDKAQFEKELSFLEVFAAYLGTPMPGIDRRTLINNFRLRPRLDPEEAICVLNMNLIRIQLGLKALAIDMKLTDAARGHSKDMQDHKFFSHTSPLPGKTRPGDRARLSGTTGQGENIHMGQPKGKVANLAWWHSPGHHVNMLYPYKRVGLGRCNKHWTQMFAR